jgi:hypothetical protein
MWVCDVCHRQFVSIIDRDVHSYHAHGTDPGESLKLQRLRDELTRPFPPPSEYVTVKRSLADAISALDLDALDEVLLEAATLQYVKRRPCFEAEVLGRAKATLDALREALL